MLHQLNSPKEEIQFIKTSIEIRRDIFDRRYIQNSLKSKFDDLKCSQESCQDMAAAVREKVSSPL